MTPEAGSYVVRFRISSHGADTILPALKQALAEHKDVALVHGREVDVFYLGPQPMQEYGAVDCRGFSSFLEAVRIVREAGWSISEPMHPRILEGDLSAKLY